MLLMYAMYVPTVGSFPIGKYKALRTLTSAPERNPRTACCRGSCCSRNETRCRVLLLQYCCTYALGCFEYICIPLPNNNSKDVARTGQDGFVEQAILIARVNVHVDRDVRAVARLASVRKKKPNSNSYEHVRKRAEIK